MYHQLFLGDPSLNSQKNLKDKEYLHIIIPYLPTAFNIVFYIVPCWKQNIWFTHTFNRKKIKVIALCSKIYMKVFLKVQGQMELTNLCILVSFSWNLCMDFLKTLNNVYLYVLMEAQCSISPLHCFDDTHF